MMENDTAKFIKKRLASGYFSYKKENCHDIAPCSYARRCKNHHRKCIELDDCLDRACTIPEKLDTRCAIECVIHGWKKKPPRLRQMKKAWVNEYQFIHRKLRKHCDPCQEEYCSANGVKNANCKLDLGVLV